MNELLRRAAAAALHNCLAVQPGERLLIAPDEAPAWALPLFATAAEEADASQIARPEQADVIICFTTAVPETAQAAVGRGARLVHMPGLKPETFARALFVDFKTVAVRARHVTSLLEAASEAQIKAEGVDLTLPLSGPAAADTGILRAPGSAGQLPAGEARRGRLGVGCNERALVWGDPLEDRKARGSVTVDGTVIPGASLWLDGRLLVDRGELLTM